MVVMSKFHSPDNYWGNMRIDGDAAKKPTYVRPSLLLLKCTDGSSQTAINLPIPLPPRPISLVNQLLKPPTKLLPMSFLGDLIGPTRER